MAATDGGMAATDVAAATDIELSEWMGVTRLVDLPPLKVVWQFEERTYTGHTGWVDMDQRIVQVIQKGMEGGNDVIPFPLRGRTYEVDLTAMVQRVIHPHRPHLTRAIRHAFLPSTPEVGASAGRMKEAADEATEQKADEANETNEMKEGAKEGATRPTPEEGCQ